MLTDSEIRKLCDSPLLRHEYIQCDHPEENAALPDVSLGFLVELCHRLEVATVFEFGSGRSTVALLKAGFSVISLEDSRQWMDQTNEQIPDLCRARHTSLVQPLSCRFHGLIPVMDWKIDSHLSEKIKNADLILVDSPYFPPFRESTLWSALNNNNHALVIIDDTRIPTLSRFCDRLAASNPFLLHRRVEVGHTFDIFARLNNDLPLKKTYSPLEVLKGWRRFCMRRQ